MRFGPWYPLTVAAEHAPAAAGVLQIRRAVGLVDYPTGKSAMLLYAHAIDVRATALAIAARHGVENLWGRHLIDAEPATDLAAFCESLRTEFVRRFGAVPMFEAHAMKLVEAESVGPVEGEEAIVTPPRPPHRRVSVSLVFTLTVLIGTVVAIFLVFPARHAVFLSEAIARQRSHPAWDLADPSSTQVRAWAMGLVGARAPLPALDPPVRVIGVARIELLDRPAALMRLAVGADEVTYIVQPSRGIAKKADERTDGDLHAVSVRRDGYSSAAAGPAATADRWLAILPH